MTQQKSKLEITNLVIEFDTGLFKKKRVIDGLYLTVQPGEVVAITGQNGTGKTTLLRSIFGLVPIKTGTISLDQTKTGYVPESRSLPPYLTAIQLMHLAGSMFNMSSADLRKKSLKLLEKFMLNDVANTKIGCFSKGMTQRLLLAQALVNDPKLLVMDEPFSGLDTASKVIVNELVDDFKTNGRSVLYTTHDRHEQKYDKLVYL